MRKTLHLLRMARGLMSMTVITVLLSAVPASALADAQPYARLDGNTLTFYYDENKTTDDYGLVTPDWLSKKAVITTVVFDESFRNYKPVDCYEWFHDMYKLSSIEGMENFDTSSVRDMEEMFRGCAALTELDLSHFNTANVESMRYMFEGCTALTELDLSSFDITSTRFMGYMFHDCTSLTKIDVSHFDASNNNEDAMYMFCGCTALKALDLSHFNTANVLYMLGMFSGCTALTTLNLANFNTANVEEMSKMFNECKSLTELDLSSFNTAKVTGMAGMFRCCTALATIFVSDDFTAKSVEDDVNIFSSCNSLITVRGYHPEEHSTSDLNYISGCLTKKVGTNGSDIIGASGSPLTIRTLAIDDNKAYVLNEGEVCRAGTATYSRTMTSNWGTLCLPFAIDAAAEVNTCNFYSLQSVDAESVSLTQIQKGTIKAGTPVVIRKKDNSQTGIEITATNVSVVSAPVNATSSDRLVGTFDGEVLTDNGYFIAKNRFYSVVDYASAGVKVNPFRAYISASDTNRRAAALRIVADESTTGIDATDAIDSLNDATTEYYDMNGRRINGLQKGINIVKTGNKTIKVTVK